MEKVKAKWQWRAAEPFHAFVVSRSSVDFGSVDLSPGVPF
jgi:hypothetical protein